METAVKAAEQTIKGDKKGVERKAEVIDLVTAWLVERGINISSEQLDSLIEAAVYGLKEG